MEDDVTIVFQQLEHVRIGDRPSDEAHPGISGDVLRLGRKQIVDDENLRRTSIEKRAHEVCSDKARPANDEKTAVVHEDLDDPPGSERPFRCVNVSVTPKAR